MAAKAKVDQAREKRRFEELRKIALTLTPRDEEVFDLMVTARENGWDSHMLAVNLLVLEVQRLRCAMLTNSDLMRRLVEVQGQQSR